MGRLKETIIAQDHIDDTFLDEEMSESDVIRLKDAALLDELRSLQCDILERKDRLVYYNEPLSLIDLESLTRRIKRILTDFS